MSRNTKVNESRFLGKLKAKAKPPPPTRTTIKCVQICSSELPKGDCPRKKKTETTYATLNMLIGCPPLSSSFPAMVKPTENTWIDRS